MARYYGSGLRTIVVLILLPVFTALATAPPVIKSVALHGTRLRVNLQTQVGHPYDIRVIDDDVRRLWRTARFNDIKVETAEEPEGTAVVFNVIENPALKIHEFRFEPHSYGIRLNLPEGTPISALRAHQIALQARDELVSKGYVDAEVDPEMVPVAGNTVDLKLAIHATRAVSVKQIDFVGSPGLDEKELRGALQALRVHRLVPKIPGIWQGWRLWPSYSREAIGADLARLHSLYVSKGYFDAKVRLDDAEIQGKDASVRIFVDSGPRYRVREWSLAKTGKPPVTIQAGPDYSKNLCDTVFKQQRGAERQGILDFNARMQVRTSGEDSGADPAVDAPEADVMVALDEGRPYKVGRIEFSGLGPFKDEAARSNFVLDEGELFDQQLLRKSVERLNQSSMFDPVGVHDVVIQSDEKTGVASVSVRLHERKRGAWSFSGPVGPASVGGPLQASIMSRLPGWGRGVYELSTYSLSLSVLAFASPFAPILGLSTKAALLPIVALRRPYSPGQGWKSGFFIAPQLGWQYMTLGYGITQLQRRAIPLLQGENSGVPDLVITVEGSKTEGPLFCAPPKPRFSVARRVAVVGLQFLGALASF